MKRKAIGFYWTLPVPWARFNTIDTGDAAAAAQQSKTIALQRQAVQAYAKAEGYDPIHEATHIEVAPDRGGAEIRGELQKLAALAREQGGVILYVDFGQAIDQRSHQYLRDYVGNHAGLFAPVALDWTHEEAFRAHFGTWRVRQTEWTAGKAARVAAAKARTAELKAQGHKLPQIAQMLEAEILRSASGKPWTADSLRKALKP